MPATYRHTGYIQPPSIIQNSHRRTSIAKQVTEKARRNYSSSCCCTYACGARQMEDSWSETLARSTEASKAKRIVVIREQFVRPRCRNIERHATVVTRHHHLQAHQLGKSLREWEWRLVKFQMKRCRDWSSCSCLFRSSRHQYRPCRIKTVRSWDPADEQPAQKAQLSSCDDFQSSPGLI